MLELQGTHGTTKTRARRIIETKNPEPSQVGHLGSGFYLWRHDRFAYALAIGWCRQQKARGEYRNDPDPECTALVATLSVSKDEIVDLDDYEYRDLLSEFLADLGDIKDDIKRSDFFDSFVYFLEKLYGMNITLVQGRTIPPKGKHCPEYPRLVLDNPIVFVVKNSKPIQSIAYWSNCHDER